MDDGRSKRPETIRHNHQEEPASDAGERKKEKSGGAVRLRRWWFWVRGLFDSTCRLVCRWDCFWICQERLNRFMVKFVNIILAETHPNKEAAASIRSQRAIQHKLLKHNPDVKWQTPRVRFPFLSVSSPSVFILFYSFLFCFILFAMQRYYFFW